MNNTLIDPPYTFAPYDEPWVKLSAMQSVQSEPLMCTSTSLARTAPHVLLLLLEAPELKLKEYAPMNNTLNDPPIEFAPLDEIVLESMRASTEVKALQLNEVEF